MHRVHTSELIDLPMTVQSDTVTVGVSHRDRADRFSVLKGVQSVNLSGIQIWFCDP